MAFKKMDMHVHSCFSVEPVPGLSDVTFSPLQTPIEIYERAKARGMDFVTITDHDTIDGCLDLLARRPNLTDFVVGEEVSTQLPQSLLTVHINVYGHNQVQHEELQRRRADAFEVVRYCKEQGLYCAWNHPFYRENLSTIEETEFMELVRLVDVLEVRNGGRSQVLNVLAEELAVREGKGMQGGSDTHTGNVGSVYTAVPCRDLASFFAGILAGNSHTVGHHSTPRTFLKHNYLVGRRQIIDRQLGLSRTLARRLRIHWLAALSFALSPWIVRRHFRSQTALAQLALRRLSHFHHMDRFVLDAA